MYKFTKLELFFHFSHITELESWLNNKLNSYPPKEELSSTSNKTSNERSGRIGPARIIFDLTDNNPLLNVSKDKLTIQSQNAFSTVKANVAVFKGKWMYEVQLHTEGVMQIGWCSTNCKFTQNSGVGDTQYSYGFDGSNQRIWHIQTDKYGPNWRSGDIFGICLDMDDGRIEYYRNGAGLGEAFKHIERGPGLALYPAVSIAFNESLTANFGGTPFRYPVIDYNPLQELSNSILHQTDCLLQFLNNISRIMSRYQTSKTYIQQSGSGVDLPPTENTVYLVLSSIIVEYFTPLLLNPYIIEDKIFNFIQHLCVINNDENKDSVINSGETNSTLDAFLTILWTHLELDDMKTFLNKLIYYLLSVYKEVPTNLEYKRQQIVISVLTSICYHNKTRKYLLEFKFFKRNWYLFDLLRDFQNFSFFLHFSLPVFLYIRPPDEKIIKQLFPDDHIWTDALDDERSKDLYFAAIDKLKLSTVELYELQKNLLITLLLNEENVNDDWCETPSSRKIFLSKFRNYILENSLDHRVSQSIFINQ